MISDLSTLMISALIIGCHSRMGLAEIKGYLQAADKGLDVADKGLDVTEKAWEFFGRVFKDIKNGTVSKRALIFDDRPAGQPLITFFVYTTIGPRVDNWLYQFPSAPQKTTNVYCPGSGGMIVLIDNKPPRYSIEREKVYVFDGQTFESLDDVAHFKEMAEKYGK